MPGVGKGTISKRLESEFGIRHISTGEILRKASQENTEISRKIRGILNSGNLVPDDFMCELIKNEIRQDEKKFILDGFPRTFKQAQVLSEFVEIDATLYFTAKQELIIKRLEKRAKDLEEFREDDKKEIILNRFKLFEKNIELLLQYYRDRKLLREIAAGMDIETVFKHTKEALELD